MFLKTELLNRAELLYPDDTRFSDLRRAYIDKDWSSMFRVFEEIWGVPFDDPRNAVMEGELHAIFRLWEEYPYICEDLRKASLEDNIWSLFRLFDPDCPSLVSELVLTEEGFDPRDFKKLVMGDNSWSMYRLLLHYQETQIIRAIKYLQTNGIRFDKDCLSQGQIQSKMWVLKELKKLDLELGTVFLCAGWYGILSTLMFEHGLNIDCLRSFDIDPECEFIAGRFNHLWEVDNWRFKAATYDIRKIDYTQFKYDVVGGDGVVTTITDTPNTIINTSCEHIADFATWYDLIPAGKYLVLQSNNYHGIAEHVNLSDTLAEFAAQTPMTEVLYEGELGLEKYTRWMRIGIK